MDQRLENQPKNRSLHDIQLLPPSLHPWKHAPFIELQDKREVYGRVTQCQTGHAYTGEFHHRFHPNKNYKCPCRAQLQTWEHILHNCPWYDHQRHLLHTASRDISLPEILGTTRGINALTELSKKQEHSHLQGTCTTNWSSQYSVMNQKSQKIWNTIQKITADEPTKHVYVFQNACANAHQPSQPTQPLPQWNPTLHSFTTKYPTTLIQERRTGKSREAACWAAVQLVLSILESL